jgi:tetratricopeptide (TPR) repeat protein
MPETTVETNRRGGRLRIAAGAVLLGVWLCAIALRATVVEAPGGRQFWVPGFGDGLSYSLWMSAALLAAAVIRLACGAWGRSLWRPGRYTALGLGLFAAAGVISFFAASDRRAAVTDFAILAAPVLSALVLAQAIAAGRRTGIVLAVVAALGVVSAFQCAEQFSSGGDAAVEQYEKDPRAVLDRLGIEQGTFPQMLFEHRLHSRDVSGFFTTGNSAGSFAILALFAAAAIFLDAFKNRRERTFGNLGTAAAAAGAVIVLVGLLLTRSKGAIVSLAAAGGLLAAVLFFSQRLRRHRGLLIAAGLAAAVLVVAAAVAYGTAHGRLPGGNSMLVRWQYWRSSAEMIADHPFTGVGGGNFTYVYPLYKPDCALEAVSDPHCFPVSILVQYGPLGLLGFTLMVLAPLWPAGKKGSRTLLGGQPSRLHAKKIPGTFFAPFLYALAVAAVLVFLRPVISPTGLEGGEAPAAVFIYLYIVPAVVFLAGLALFAAAGPSDAPAPAAKSAVACGLLAVLLHNTIDFAIFEPGVWTCYWALAACLLAMKAPPAAGATAAPAAAGHRRLIAAAAGIGLLWAFVQFAVLPVTESRSNIRRARNLALEGRFEQAGRLLETAAKIDPFSPEAPEVNGRIRLQAFYSGDKDGGNLLDAERRLLEAAGRNPADFRNYEKLAEVYGLLAETPPEEMRRNWLEKAFEAASKAAGRYPGCGRLHYTAAGIAESLGRTEAAVAGYRRAIEIENAYREQFRVMYPGAEMFSRLGQDKYRIAAERLEALTGR